MAELNKKDKNFAQALFQSAVEFRSSSKTGEKPEAILIGEELSLIRALLVNSEKLKSAIKNQTILDAEKAHLLLSFFPRISDLTRSFLKVLAERSQLDRIYYISEEYNKILLKFNCITKINLYVASPLEEVHGAPLLSALKKLTGSKEIIIKPIFSPRLLAGLALEYNSKTLNVSIQSEINRLF
jgi:ATP synthase F1 delta subunit